MTFLNPFMLFGLAAAAIPILLHLLNLRKLKTVEFSSLRFLRELQRTRMRRIRLRQWILLALRTLLVLSLVLAFARPTLKGSLAGFGGASARSSIILLIDDSPSMGLRNPGGVLFDQSRAAARRIIALARPGDEIIVTPLSAVAAEDSDTTSLDPKEALRVVDAMQTSNTFTPYAPAMRRALLRSRASATVNKELYLLTDLQGTHFAPDSSADRVDTTDGAPASVFLAGFPPPRRDNAAVTSATVESKILAQSRPMTVRAVIQNFSEQPSGNGVASLYIEGTRVAQQSFTLGPRGSAPVELTGVPKRRGVLGCSVRIEDDILEIDNRRNFSIAIPETITVLITGGTPASIRFPYLALSLAGDSSVAGLFRVRQMPEERLMTADIEATDVLVLCAGRTMPAGAGARIANAVRNGMGLMVFPGPETDADALTRTLFAPLGIPAPALPAARPADETGAGFLRFGAIDLSHPVFAGMFERTSMNTVEPPVESPRITAAATLSTGTTGTSLVSMTDGRPFLAEYRAGGGRIILCAVDAGTAWSDLPVRGIFAPLLHRSMVYLAAVQASGAGAHIGERLTLTLPRAYGESRREFMVLAPDGSEERVVPHVRAGALLFATAPAEMPGLYTLQYADAVGPAANRTPLQAVAVNAQREESDLTGVSDDGLTSFFASLGITSEHVTRLQDAETLERTVGESRYGVELWHIFLGLALLSAALEMVIARTTRAATAEGTNDA